MDWRIAIIVPLYKRGNENEVGNYRGISLLCSAYKIYAEVLRNRLEKEIEQKGGLPESQEGFRKGRVCSLKIANRGDVRGSECE